MCDSPMTWRVCRQPSHRTSISHVSPPRSSASTSPACAIGRNAIGTTSTSRIRLERRPGAAATTGVKAGPSCLVLEYIEGTPLRGPLPPSDAIPLALQVADAIDTAHQQGILHRDLKPANILVTRDGRAKVLDFGLAKF